MSRNLIRPIMNLKTTSKEFASPDNFGIVDPEMTTAAEPRSLKSRASRRTIGFVTASSIVIANIIGTGIFTSLGFQLADIQSGFPLLMLWIIGGIAALCGALCYGELSAALPRSGGEYHFLSQIYHPALGFMAGFVSATVGFAAPIALAAMAFGKYFVGVFGVGSPVFLSFVVVWAVTAFHLGNLQVGSAFQNLSTLVKLLLIGALIAAGLFVHPKQPISFLPAPGDTIAMFGAPFAVALVYVMYSYSGWNAASYITGEIKKPEKTVPRSLIAGTGLVIVIYVLLNAIFLATTPVQELKGQIQVALIAGKHIFGTNGGRVAGAVICLGLVSAISSMTWIGPRVSMSMGEDHWLLRMLGRKNPHGIPTSAIALQLLIVNLLLLTRSFESVVQYTQFSLLLCSLFTVVGVMVLRATRPEIARPYRVWAYPLPPIIFAVITLWMMFYLLRWKTIESLAGLATALVGLLLYFCARNHAQRQRSA
jgi:APA family basic amino acid/polyamine antiporter